MPCQALVDLGRDSTILIHESTYENEFDGRAQKSTHSTDGQALEQGRKMNAKFILLTHFSQSRRQVPLINHDLKNVGIAFDNMEVVLSDLDQLSMMYPVMRAIF